MKLIYRIIIRLLLVLTVVLTTWGILFYVAIIEEINDETDDSLENYSENIITKALTGQNLPSHSDGSNNFYYLTEVSRTYAEDTPHIRYSDEEIFLAEKDETEPARVLKTIFKDQNGRFFELKVSTPTIEKTDLQEAILQWVIILYLTLLIIILIINIWVFYGSMKPLYVLLKWLDHYTIGQQTTPPELKNGVTEFKKLYTAAIRSAKRNQAIFEQQKQFIGNASHELQTPLAICQNRLEILSENESITEEQLQEINKIQQTLSHIIRLNKSLLLLSKIENGQYQENQDLCLNEIIQRQSEDYKEIFGYKEISLYLEEKDLLYVRMNETLAITLVTNLLKNAYVHNHHHGKIHIYIFSNRIIVSNTSTTKALDEHQIFQRFYQGQNASQNSSGLGLSIAEAICKIYNFPLRYTYSGEHQFEIIFK